MDTLRVMVVDDTSLYRMLVTNSLRAVGGVEVFGSAANGQLALELGAFDFVGKPDGDALSANREVFYNPTSSGCAKPLRPGVRCNL
ncbi:MAG: DNA-binding NarL/FixJ family response regulator [Candidatus Latescibacterota bacterium]